MPTLFESIGLAEPTAPPPPEKPKGAGFLRTIADMGVKGAQGVVDLGQSAVGLASLATGGLAGKGMRAIGYDPEQTNQALGEFLSPAQREAEANVQAADGFVDTLRAAADNPRAVAGAIAESVPGMLGIGGMTKAVAQRIALRAAAPFGGITTEAGAKAAQDALEAASTRLLATSGAAEGAQSAGQIADQAQAAGRDYADYAVPALASGAATGAITVGAGKALGDPTTALFAGSAKAGGLAGKLPARMLKGGVSEGVLQEMPQSAQEQAMTNVAMGEKDITKGVGSQAAMGLATGFAMGVGEGGAARAHAAPPTQKQLADQVRATETVPEGGTLSAAANVGTELKAQDIENGPLPAEPEPMVDAIAERIKRLSGQDREDAMHAYNVVQRDDVAKGVRQYNSKLLDKLLAKLEEEDADKEAQKTRPRLTYDTTPTGTMIAGEDGSVRPETRADVINRAQLQAEQDAENERRVSLGLAPLPVARAVTEARAAAPAQETAAPAPSQSNESAPSTAGEKRTFEIGGHDPHTVTYEHLPDGRLVRTIVYADDGSSTRHTLVTDRNGEEDWVSEAGYSKGEFYPQQLSAEEAKSAIDVDLSGKKVEGTTTAQPEKAKAPASSASGTFKTPEEAQAYISQQRRSGGTAQEGALPLPMGDGTFGVATKSHPQYAQAQAFQKQQEQRAAGILEGDVLAKNGEPFKAKLPAMNAAKKLGDGHEVAPVKGGLVVRAKEWQAFPPNTNTLGIPRAEMPQVKTEHHGALVNFLNARGVEHQIEDVDPSSLKPSQAEYSAKRVEEVGKAVAESDRSILVSSDNHVLDGHHQWLAAGAEGKPVKVIRLSKPAAEVLPLMKEFPSAETAKTEGGEHAAQEESAATRATEAAQAPAPDEAAGGGREEDGAHARADRAGADGGEGTAAVVGFTTSKGSTYEVHDDGTTTRNKAARADAGHEGDSGPKTRSARTVYVDGDAANLSAAGMDGLGEKGARVAIRDGKASLVWWNESKGGWGAAKHGRDIVVHNEPAVGRYPLELWDKKNDVPGFEAYANMHAGNSITELRTTDSKGEPHAVPEQGADASRVQRSAGPDDEGQGKAVGRGDAESQGAARAQGQEAERGDARGEGDQGVAAEPLHQERGHAPEQATPTVIGESLKKAASREQRPFAVMRLDLLKQVDKAIAKAPQADTTIGTTAVRTERGRQTFSGMKGEVGSHDRILLEVRQSTGGAWHIEDPNFKPGKGAKHVPLLVFQADGPADARKQVERFLERVRKDGTTVVVGEPNMVTFDVAGDGKFKVMNTVERLQEFRKKVEASPGFTGKHSKPVQSRTNGYGMKKEAGSAFGVERGSDSPRTAVQNMVEEGDYQAAVDYANAKGIELASLKLTKDAKKQFDAFMAAEPKATDAAFSRAADQTKTEAFRRWSNDAPLVRSSDADDYEFKTGQKVVVEAFHGTKRPDRVGTIFKRSRATSGPMSFFTAAPELASSYAQGKQDTSLSNEDQAYETWFKYKPDGHRGNPYNIAQAWWSLPQETRTKIEERAPRVMFSDEQEDDGGNKIVLGPDGHKSGTGGYDMHIKEARGNHLQALVEEWLNSGNLFNDEERFMQVLKLAGMPVQHVAFDSPHAEYPAVYPVYIAMQKPLVTSDIPQPVRDALTDAARRDRQRAAAAGADMWDKNTRTLREWVKAFNGADNRYVWTSIPDKVTAVLKSLGYDGIIDWSGKGGGTEHPVYIPFEESQVKSATGNKGTFDPLKSNILFSRSPIKSVVANERRGREAMNKAIMEKADQHRAMFRTGMGWIDFVWGDDKKGLQHVFAQRAQNDGMTREQTTRMLVNQIVAAVARGEEVRRSVINDPQGKELSTRAVIAHDGHEAILVQNRGSNTWLLSGWEKKSPGAAEAGNDTPAATRRAADSTDNTRGAGDESDSTPGGQLRRGGESGKPMSATAVQDAVSKLTGSWLRKPAIHVIEGMDEAPPAVFREWQRQNSQGATGEPEGFHYRGEVYLLVPHMRTQQDVARVLFHEALGHFGLRGVFGDALKPILKNIAGLRRAEVERKAEQYGLDTSKEGERLMAAEEVLAEMAQSRPDIGFVKRAIAAIRTWLRDNVPGFKNLALTDDEIIRNYLLPARGWVERGRDKAATSVSTPAFSQRSAPAFTSALRDRVADGPNQAPAGEWGKYIDALTKKGVSPAEIEWSGVTDWLKLQQGKVTKDQVLDFLRENGVQVQAVVKGRDGQSDLQKERDELNVHLTSLGFDHEDDGYGSAWITRRKDGEQFTYDDHEKTFVSEEGEKVPPPVRMVALRLGELEDQLSAIDDGLTDAGSDSTRYESYTLPGGENYREVLLTLPERTSADMERFKELQSIYSDHTQEQREEYNRLGIRLHPNGVLRPGEGGSVGENFHSSHWDEPNVLAHIRLNDRTDADGKKVLFVEEIQSDWAQKGRKDGFQQAVDVASLEREKNAAFDEWQAAVKANEVAMRTGTAAEINATSKDRNVAFDRQIAAQRAYTDGLRASDQGVPRAPFVTNTDAWVSLALKKIMQLAVDGGYDKVAFVNGQQSADRYDLSKHIDSLSYLKEADGQYRLKVYKKRGTHWEYLGIYPEDKLTDVVGKDLAQSIIDDKGREIPHRPEKMLSGLDLKVGGEGMLSFYNKVLPTIANKLLTKLGGDKMGTVRFNTAAAPEQPRTRGGHFASGKMQQAPREQPGFDVTPALRAKVEDGLPMFSRSSTAAAPAQRDAATIARDTFNDFAATSKTFNWWNKTVGTQYQKAQQDKHFKRVFEAVQDYLSDVSRLANDSADRARDLLPRLENLKDVFKDTLFDKNPTRERDVKAIAKPIFQGTLADLREYKAEELKRVFGLDDKQVELYKQFRAAVNKSLDDLTTSTAAKLLRNAGIPSHMISDQLEQGDHKGLADLAAEWAQQDPKMAGLAEQMREISARAEKLKKESYAPLMRFGQYAVSLRDAKTGALLEFHLFENERKANAKARELQGKGTVDKSVMSKEDYKLLKGVSPESLELFGDILEKAGMFDTRDEVYQQYLRQAIDQRSAMKRMIHREGYPGYSQDVRRVLATFVTSNARLASKNLHFSNMLEAAENIPKAKGDVRDEATNLVKYVQEPQEEAHKLRGLLFAQFIGGNVASALVNSTQTITMTYPWLSQYTNPAKAAATALSAMKQAAGTPKGELGEALARAEQSGVVSPQEIHHLNAEAMATFGSHPYVQKAMFLWGSLFSLAEQFNRRVAFIAAYDTAVEKKMDDPYAFAVRAVEETQGVYNKGNRPNWARGAVGSTLFTFKQFSIAYLEFLSRLPAREKALALAVLFMAAGAEGLPFADDIEDVVDTIAQRLGFDFNSKAKTREWMAEVLDEGASEFVHRGISSVPGMPIDVSARMGLANLIPGTGMLRKDTRDHMKDVLEFAGPAGSQVQSATKVANGEGWKNMAPTSLQNLAKAVDMFQTGMYRDNKGKKVIDIDRVDALWKGIGFQPADVAQDSLRRRVADQQETLAKEKHTELIHSIAQARFEDDPEAEQAARQDLRDWNENNPGWPLKVRPQDVQAQLKKMRQTAQERTIKGALKSTRESLRAQLQ